MALLKFHQDITYLKKDKQQKDSGTSQGMSHKTNCSTHYHKEHSNSTLNIPTAA